ncbi:serine/threonine-protein kinase Nek1 isoform X3 [Corythoichthys intestinalis]|uniref:serine/threonine-protein kinase Nek1 isoform X3 n=1 Tax=Corythoichthys intestinalis TaxID=161448 RepID=UPI0025A4FB52|nr:serine/threonine-protein kinase Nek1 isoform X3 [Corythoichthys intestinalis]
MDKYEKVKKIGEGSFGKAVLVKDKEDGHQYVIKEVSISGMSEKARQESRKEVAVLANMSHPNIVKYKESFEEGGCLYIVMGYCEGGDLFKKINSQRGILFPEEQILDWFVQICLALKHIHDRKILHRDIKSQNIFLTKDGTVQLGDFGIARVLNSTVELARTCIGTPYYLSPEICENKPYNNKSDIWALGCVLYEMCTLKHAFEAGNMKNLVLKIIRGSYHPVAVHYSPELHSLLAQLFKHDPKERPSVSRILDKPFLSCRIQSFLTPQVIAQEFHHISVHKQKKKGAHQGSEAKRPAHGFIPSVAAKITAPACKYRVPLTARKVSVTKKPVDKKTAIKYTPAPASIQRRVSQGDEDRRKQEVIKKRKNLIDKEKLREQISRMNHAREQGWKNVLISSTGSPERTSHLGGGKRAADVPSSPPSSVLSRNPYENYHAALDQMAKQSNEVGLCREGSAGPGTPIRSVPAAVGPVLPNGPAPLLNPDTVKMELQRLQHVSKQKHMSRQKTRLPAERVYQVEEFLQRKKEALLNKVRAEGHPGTRQNWAAICGSQVASARYRRRPHKVNKEEEEYLTALRQIRLQNFNERQQIQARLKGEMYGSDSSESLESAEEAELRRKKIAAFKVHANARAAVLKEQLEKKRREANEREKKAWDDHIAAQGERVPPAAVSTTSKPTTVKSSALPESEPPASVISMTVALKNVGAMTPLMDNLPGTEAVTIIQSEKKQILNRLNQNLKSQSPVDEMESIPIAPKQHTPAFHQEPYNSENVPYIKERNKWAVVELSTSQKVLEESSVAASNHPPSVGDRKKWQEGLPFFLPIPQQTLEETCIPTIEKNTGEVIRGSAMQDEGQRKAWGVSPECPILRVFHEAEVQPLTQPLETVGIYKEASPDEANQSVAMSASGEETSDKKGPAAIVKVEAKMEYVPTTEAMHPEKSSVMQAPSNIAEIQDPEDVESVVLEDVPEVSHTSMGLHHAWEKQDQQSMPPEVSTNKGAAVSAGREGLSQGEEPLFMKLCSPAHRRTSALALISAQSSVDESSSSLASRSRSVSPLHTRKHNALLIGLSTGLFDANNPKMLRTCSLPDLSRVFISGQESVIIPENNVAPDGHSENEDQDQAKDDDQSETEDVYDDDDDDEGLQDIRASMERLLQEERELMDNLPHDGRGDFNGNTAVGQDKDLFKQILVEPEQDNYQMALGSDDDDADNDDEECSNDSPVDEEGVDLLNNGVGEENHANKNQFNEEWQSDNSEENQEGEMELYDSIYCRLEEHRFNLERQIGFEKFIEAYNKIKAIRDDEDDNIDVGTSLAFSILGSEHQHLYPNILHLVMGDGAYQEGNDQPWSQSQP